ncbi:hypothetical protein B0H16DRAFT_1758049 [Mycena metata]|uniref:Uncharacterized protein n=1 Tax=Mycena metata TaxID=1033252 RepID=A0AAD7MZU9_9AGAR|nr:hypothetical protein B0H16DRAFT_1758049 [Mycena metata]
MYLIHLRLQGQPRGSRLTQLTPFESQIRVLTRYRLTHGRPILRHFESKLVRIGFCSAIFEPTSTKAFRVVLTTFNEELTDAVGKPLFSSGIIPGSPTVKYAPAPSSNCRVLDSELKMLQDLALGPQIECGMQIGLPRRGSVGWKGGLVPRSQSLPTFIHSVYLTLTRNRTPRLTSSLSGFTSCPTQVLRIYALLSVVLSVVLGGLRFTVFGRLMKTPKEAVALVASSHSASTSLDDFRGLYYACLAMERAGTSLVLAGTCLLPPHYRSQLLLERVSTGDIPQVGPFSLPPVPIASSDSYRVVLMKPRNNRIINRFGKRYYITAGQYSDVRGGNGGFKTRHL